MLTHPNFDPVIFSVGPLAVRWYGLMYLVGFIAAYNIMLSLARYRQLSIDKDDIADFLFYGVLGVVLGGRLGYTIFYNSDYYLHHPLEIFYVWQGGMSFHGGFLGVIVACALFCLRRRIEILSFADILATATPIGLGCGRIGNFINGELWGRPTDLPWGMVFAGGGLVPRHPSQIYQALLEGVVLFTVLWWLHRRRVRSGVPCFMFFLLYGVFRFVVEFVREPDAHLGLLWGGMSMGQWLSMPMMLIGSLGLLWLWRRG
ncbi:MAG: prolipoprotein diacylglyceryl transferase [Desulfuromonas sp.]|nr:MAG: prolipoprotein diacylglyceryl transferase [Desulfuromonas sp.]